MFVLWLFNRCINNTINIGGSVNPFQYFLHTVLPFIIEILDILRSNFVLSYSLSFCLPLASNRFYPLFNNLCSFTLPSFYSGRSLPLYHPFNRRACPPVRQSFAMIPLSFG